MLRCGALGGAGEWRVEGDLSAAGRTTGPAPAVRHGTVVEFDAERGHGEVEAEDGRRLFFHCTAIADGSRTIAVGAEVRFLIRPGHGGRWEAASVTPAGEGQAPGDPGSEPPAVPSA